MKQLTYDEAMDALEQGKKVKLPEWIGYWYKQGNKIMLITKDGDVLDTPWHDKYKDRNDWEVTDGRLGFDFAIRALKNGKMLTRQGWNGKGMYVFLIGKSGLNNGIPPYWTYTNGVNDNYPLREFLAMKTVNEEVVPWVSSQTDLLAEDWMIV